MNMLVIPRSRLKFCGDRAFSVCTPKLWNNLPEHIKCSSNLRTSKSRLKTHLFKRYFNLQFCFYFFLLSILKLLLCSALELLDKAL